MDALSWHHDRLGRLPAGGALVFASRTGTALDAHSVRRSFRRVVHAAGLDASGWTPREVRHSFVSMLSDSGVLPEHISRLVGHLSRARDRGGVPAAVPTDTGRGRYRGGCDLPDQ